MSEQQFAPTRWALDPEAHAGYGKRFAEMLANEEDIVGEARLADALIPRGATVLDAGSGMGRIGAYLQRQGHRVVAAEPDPPLVDQSRRTFPDLDVVPVEILGLSDETLRAAGAPTAYDLIVCVGNVIRLVAEGTEVAVLSRLRELLAEDGRILIGYHLRGGPAAGRDYTVAEFRAEATQAGLRIDHHFGGYDLRPADDEYAVWVLSREGRQAQSDL